MLAGCGSKSTVVGKWKVDPALTVDTPGQPAGFMTGFATTFKYEFKSDGTFTAPMSDGTYTFEGGKLSVTTKKLMGQDLAKMGGQTSLPPMTGELSADGSKLTLHLPDSPMLPANLKSGIVMVRDSG